MSTSHVVSPDVIVVGAGVIGSASAYALSRAGLRVTVLERDTVGAHASSGAAGILSVDGPPQSPFARLAQASLDLYPTYSMALRDETRIDVEFQQKGVLYLTAEGQEPEPPPPGSRVLDRSELHDLEPNIGPGWSGAILREKEGQVTSARLTRALAEAAARRGVEFIERVVVTDFLRDGDRVVGVRTTMGNIPAGTVVLAAGPWSGLLASTLARPIPIFPVKGQIIWLLTRPSALRIPVFAGEYLVPKGVAGLAVGATVEDAGFDETPTVGAIRDLMGAALDAVPILKEAEFLRAWAGVRPAAADGLPILGPHPDHPGLLLATGHFRNGVHLSLITGELVTDWVLGRPEQVDSVAFRLQRFSETTNRGPSSR